MKDTTNKNCSSEFFLNLKKIDDHYPEFLKEVLNENDSESAYQEIKNWKNYEPTKLISLDDLAKKTKVKKIHYKDESTRFGLGSFKALGGAFGVLQFVRKKLQDQMNHEITLKDIKNGKYKDIVSNYVVSTATDGNHGRSVAYGAQIFGCQCQIFIHSEVSEGRKNAMEEFGANVIRINGNYDDSLKVCIDESEKNNWQIISDTSYEGYTEYPRYIMAGYTVMAKEILDDFEEHEFPTHIFLQAGVGGFAAAMCMRFWNTCFINKTKIIIVEPTLAPCLIDSMRAGEIQIFDIKKETIMSGLSCGEPSILAWEILKNGADIFMTINDRNIPELMRLLANGQGDDQPIEAGECSVSGLAALMAIQENKEISDAINLNHNSRVLVFGTEGATDPSIYKAIING